MPRISSVNQVTLPVGAMRAAGVHPGDDAIPSRRSGSKIASLTARMAERAADLRATQSQMRLPDAVVVSCAREVGGDLLSYDERLAHHSRSPDR
jgi:PIN domain